MDATSASAATAASADQAFATYQRTRDPEALAAVFDATAPKLLLVAMHVARDAAAAEDLVQTTFLAAMRKAQRYDPARPVLPWLAGILAKEAAHVRRAGDRRLDAERLPRMRDAQEPSRALEAQELAVQVARALDGVPRLYRQILVLRLVHGLQPAQIAHALERSPQTVRSQLHRGLEMLRRALPKGLAVPVLAAASSCGRGLAAVRAVVLARATAGASGALGAAALRAALAVASTFSGGMLVQKLVLASLAVAGAAVLAFMLWPGARGTRAAVVADAQRAPPLHAANAPTTREAPPPVAERVAAPSTQPEDAPRAAALCGRCVAAESQLPLAGCTVTLRGWAANRERELQRAEKIAWHDPPPVTTDADGRFAFEFAPPPSHLFTLRIEHPGRVPITGDFDQWPVAKWHDFGDVPLALGAEVTGRVVDPAGEPVGGVPVEVQLRHRARMRELHEVTSSTACSGDDGALRFPEVLPAGVWPVAASAGFRMREPAAVLRVPEGVARAELVVVVEKPLHDALLAGIVVDAQGGPVHGAWIRAADAADGRVSHGGTYTRRDGTFELACKAKPSGPVRLHWEVPGVTNGRYLDGAFAWGTKDIRIVVPSAEPPRAVLVDVVAADTGAPIETFGVRFGTVPEREGGQTGSFSLLLSGRHAHGRVELPSLEPEPHLLIVCPLGSEYAPSMAVCFDPSAHAEAPLRVALPRPANLTVRVRDARGTPIAGTRVQLLQYFGPQPMPLDCRAGRADDAAPLRNSERALVWDERATDDVGCAVLRAASGIEFVVRALGPGHVPRAVTGVHIAPTGGELEVVAEAGAALVGSLRPVEILERLDTSHQYAAWGISGDRRPGLALIDVAARATQRFVRLPAAGQSFAVAFDGSYRITGIPAGEWEVALHAWRAPVRGGGSDVLQPLARVRLADGETRGLDLDASAHLPGRVHGRLFLDGEPFAGEWSVCGAAGEAPGTASAADGSFCAPIVPPGRYHVRLHVTGPNTGRPETLHGHEWFEVRAGEEVQRDLHVTRAVLRLRLLDADGRTPLAERRVVIRATPAGYAYHERPTTDADGWLVLDPAPPPVPLEAIVRVPDCDDATFGALGEAEQAARTVVLGPIQVDGSRRETRIALSLPRSR